MNSNRATRDPRPVGTYSCPQIAAGRCDAFDRGNGFRLVRLECHLASEAYGYGITFVSPTYIEQHWSQYFEIKRVVSGPSTISRTLSCCVARRIKPFRHWNQPNRTSTDIAETPQ
jgi:hypothetical protein